VAADITLRTGASGAITLSSGGVTATPTTGTLSAAGLLATLALGIVAAAPVGALAATGYQPTVAVGGNVVIALPGGGVSVSDDFDTDPTSRWTALWGSWTWDSLNGVLDPSGAGGGHARFTTSLGSTSHWAYVVLNQSAGGIVVRATDDASDGYYCVTWWSGSVYLSRFDNTGWLSNPDSLGLTHAAGDGWGVTVEGDGAYTKVRVWRNPANTSPVDVANWDSASDPADYRALEDTWAGKANVASATYAGCGIDDAGTWGHDNWHGGNFGGSGGLTLTGYAPTVVVAAGTTTPGVGGLVATGYAPTLITDQVRTPTVGSASVAGLAPTVGVHRVVTPGVGSAAASGLAPTLIVDRRLTPAVGSVAVGGLAPTLGVARAIAPLAGSASVTGWAPTVAVGVVVTPGVGGLTHAGLQPTVTVASAGVATPPVGVLTVTGYAPSVQTTRLPTTGALTLTGLAPTLTVQVARQGSAAGPGRG
jgi:hypothetical protein